MDNRDYGRYEMGVTFVTFEPSGEDVEYSYGTVGFGVTSVESLNKNVAKLRLIRVLELGYVKADEVPISERVADTSLLDWMGGITR